MSSEARPASGTVRLLSATGGLGFTPPDPTRSYHRALEREPHAIIADAGSADIGPLFLGSGEAYNDPEWEKLDLARLLDGVDRLGVPLVVGSCGGTGTDAGVRAFAAIVDELGRSRGRSYRTALVFSEQSRDWLHAALAAGAPVASLTPLLPELSAAAIDASDHLVAVMGAQPITAALKQGAEVVLAGRACDDALFAGAAIALGARPGPAYLAGKLLENASLVAEPFILRESVIADLDEDQVVLEPMLPEQRCTRTSVAAQLMYERATPFEQGGPGGVLDLHGVAIEELDERRVAVGGAVYREVPAALKVEGAGIAGRRSLCIAGCRDPRMIAVLEPILDEMRERVVRTGARIVVSVFGRDAVMGALEPLHAAGHEVALMVETLAATQEEANRACLLAKRLLFSAKFEGQKQTGGSITSMIDEVLEAGPSYRWTVNHLVNVESLVEPFVFELLELGEVFLMRLDEIATILRSKNAGVGSFTVDVLCPDRASYEAVKAVLTRERAAAAYGLQPEDVAEFVYFDAGLGVKLTLLRPVIQGGHGLGETDLYGSGQYAPLAELEVPDPVGA